MIIPGASHIRFQPQDSPSATPRRFMKTKNIDSFQFQSIIQVAYQVSKATQVE
jgi:hypothetical protein